MDSGVCPGMEAGRELWRKAPGPHAEVLQGCPPRGPRDSLCTQRSLVQLRVSKSAPRHSSPPLRGAGSEHSRLRQCVQSSPQADHLLHALQPPSTRCETGGTEAGAGGSAGAAGRPPPSSSPGDACGWRRRDGPGAGQGRPALRGAGAGSSGRPGGRLAARRSGRPGPARPASGRRPRPSRCGWAGGGMEPRADGAGRAEMARGRGPRVPGHSEAQAVFWTFCPSQKAPPLRGAGLVQLRLRFCQPRPQLALQTDHSVHVDHPPFTGRGGQRGASQGAGAARAAGGSRRQQAAGVPAVTHCEGRPWVQPGQHQPCDSQGRGHTPPPEPLGGLSSRVSLPPLAQRPSVRPSVATPSPCPPCQPRSPRPTPPRQCSEPTVDDDCSRGAAATGHDVLGHASVVGCVGQAGLSHHQAVLPCDVHVWVHSGVHQVLIPEPLHLGDRASHHPALLSTHMTLTACHGPHVAH